MAEIGGVLGAMTDGINISGISQGIVVVLSIIGRVLIFVLPAIAIFYLLYRRKQYPIVTDIFTQRGTTTLIGHDRIGRFVTPTGVEKHKFMSFRRRKRNIEPIPFGQIYLNEKGGNRAYLVESDKGTFYPVEAPVAGLSANPTLATAFKPINRATRFWENLEIKEALTTYSDKSFWKEYFPHISFMLLAIFIILLFAMVKGDLAAVAASAAKAAEALGTAAAQAPVTGAPGW